MFLAVLLWQGSSLALDSLERMERSQSVWNPPIWRSGVRPPLPRRLNHLLTDEERFTVLPNTVEAVRDFIRIRQAA